ncbi:hypothetical protein [uncultured Clostridium sp.]|uniref:hypothetical protein n=1 Tax=uncultured Clostridium sp. TaxID=59620 RepID=UPI0026F3A867|nr:hypothetical protein [uncultured Clostridium sp.]
MSKELLEQLMNGEIKAGSELNIRNEKRQSLKFTKKIGKIQRKADKHSKLLLLKELALPFDAFTGSTEIYNDDYKWRPSIGQEGLMLAIKEKCNENEDLKRIYLNKAKLSSWDTSNTEEITAEDRDLFRRLSTLQTFTFSCVKINIPMFTGSKYPIDYHISVESDPLTGDIIGELPVPLMINKFFRDLYYEEATAFEEENAKSPSPLNEKDLNEKKKSIYSKNPISQEIRKNFYLAVEIPMKRGNKFQDNYSFEGMTSKDIEPMLVYLTKDDEIYKNMSKYFTGDVPNMDLYTDFYEIDMECPSSRVVGDNQLELYKKTSYNYPIGEKVINVPKFEDFAKSLATYRDNSMKTLETVMTASVKIRKLSSTDEDNLIEASGKLIDINSPYLTKRVIQSNLQFLTLALGDKADALLCQAEMGMTAEGKLNEKESKKENEKFNINDALNTFDFNDDEVGDIED